MRFDKIDVVGKLWLQEIDDISGYSHGASDEGRILYAKAQKRVYFANSSQWKKLTTKYDVLESDTRMLLGYYPLPTGWNIVSAKNDRVVGLTTVTGSIGGSDGDTWTINDVQTDGSHDHGGRTGTGSAYLPAGQSDVNLWVSYTTHRHTIQVDGLHNHTFSGTWRPAYVKFCEAEYQ